jgi:hypothetical protein
LSEFKNRCKTFEKEDEESPALHNESQELPVTAQAAFGTVKRLLMQFWQHIFQEAIEVWINLFTIAGNQLLTCDVETLMQINGPDEVWEVAIACALMLKADHSNPSAVWCAMAKFGSKLVAVSSQVEQNSISNLSDILSEALTTISNDHDQNHISEYQKFLECRNKPADIVIKVSNAFLQNERNEKLHAGLLHLETLIRLEMEVRTAFGLNCGGGRLVVDLWDNFTTNERIEASSAACYIVKKISENAYRPPLIRLLNKIWKLLKIECPNAGNLDIIFLSASKLRSEQWDGGRDVCVFEWLVSRSDLCTKVQRELVQELLCKTSFQSTEYELVLLPFVNAPDYNNIKRRNQTESGFNDSYAKKIQRYIRRAGNIFQEVEQHLTNADDTMVFLNISYMSPHCSFISPVRVTHAPMTGICKGVNINKELVCRLFSSVNSRENIAMTFQRSPLLFKADILSTMARVPLADLAFPQDMLQASFDAFSWFSNESKGRLGKSSKRLEELSPRSLLMTADTSNFVEIADAIIAKWKNSGSIGREFSMIRLNAGGARSSEIPGNSTEHDTDMKDSCSSDEEGCAAGDATLDDCFSAPGTGAKERGRTQGTHSHIHDSTVQCMENNAVIRLIQIEMNRQQHTQVEGVAALLILPDVKYTKIHQNIQVSQNPVCMHAAYRQGEGFFFNCSCSHFQTRARHIKPHDETEVENLVIWFFNSSKVNLLSEQEVKGFCMHVEVKRPLERIFENFVNQTSYTWHEQTSKFNVVPNNPELNQQNYKHSSIAFTEQRGLVLLGDELYQNIPIVAVRKFASTDHSNPDPISAALCPRENPIFSVDCPSEGEKRHALVLVSSRRMVHASDSSPQQQMSCELCGSKLKSFKTLHCQHITAVLRALNGGGEDSHPGKQSRKPKKTTKKAGIYNPDGVDPDCEPGQERTGFEYPSYTNRQHCLDYCWKKGKMCWGGAISRPIAEARNKMLDSMMLSPVYGKHYSYYQVEEGLILQGTVPEKCPNCSSPKTRVRVKKMDVVLHMSDKKIVHTEVKFWLCAQCKFRVHNDGYDDGFWYINPKLAVSTQNLWDLLSLQMQGRGIDFAAYCETCSQGAQNAMRDTRNKFVNCNQMSDFYFAFYCRLQIVFNQACYGCIADAKKLPADSDFQTIQRWAKNAPPGCRDTPAVGFDGLARFVSRGLVTSKKGPLSEVKNKDRADLKSTKRSDVPERKLGQNDRCAIKTGGYNMSSQKMETAAAVQLSDIRQCAIQIRTKFYDLGNSILGILEKRQWHISLDETLDISQKVRELSVLIRSENSSQSSLLQPLILAELCANPTALYDEFLLIKAGKLIEYTGKLMKQIAARNSILVLMKHNAVQHCTRFSNAAKTATPAIEIMAQHSKLQSVFKSRLGTPGPAAHTLDVLLDYFHLNVDGTATSPLQMRVNSAVLETLCFVAERCQEVFDLYGYAEGKRPFPVRAPGQYWNEWSDQELQIERSEEPSNPILDNGAYFFTKDGRKLRKLPSENERVDSDKPDAPDVPEDGCKKPGYTRDRRAGQAAGKQMVFCLFCVFHSIQMGYHIVSNSEGRKDPFYAIFCHKPTCPHSTSYDYCCG